MRKSRIDIVAAWIVGGCTILAALIGIFGKGCQPEQEKQSMKVKDSPRSKNTQAAGNYTSQEMNNSPGAFQIAGDLNINKPLPRVFDQNYAKELNKVLPSNKAKKIQFEVIADDREALDFINQIKNYLNNEGFTNISDEPNIWLMPTTPIEKQATKETDTEFIIKIGHNQ